MPRTTQGSLPAATTTRSTGKDDPRKVQCGAQMTSVYEER